MNSIKKNRRVQRLRLDPPLPARIGSSPAKLIDLSVFGAGVEHFLPVHAGSRLHLFVESDPPLELDAVVTRCTMHLESGSSVYRSGLSFRHSKAHTPSALKELLTRELTKAIDVWKANARGVLPETIEDMPVFRTDDVLVASQHRKRATSFVWYRLVKGEWQMSVTLDPNQPLDGFSVSADDDQTEMELLKQTYEETDDAGRDLIRLFANLSIASAAH